MTEVQAQVKPKLTALNIRPVGGGFIISAQFDDDQQFIVEDKVAQNQAKLKKVIKFYLDELNETV